ncbi:MAG: hypothetical protein IJH43_09985 [Mogibacterium sp.]|nr:hypothetical protein [Mogibacterium sp.]
MDKRMDSKTAINEYIRIRLPKPECEDKALYIARKSHSSVDDAKKFLNAWNYFNKISVKNISNMSEKHIRMISIRTGLSATAVREMFYFANKYDIENGLSDNAFFVKIYPTLESYMTAEKITFEEDDASEISEKGEDMDNDNDPEKIK